MSCIPGRLSRVQASYDGGSTYANLGGIVDANLNGNVDELECTTHDSNGVRAYLPNHIDFTMDLTMRWDEDELGQVDLLGTLSPPTSFKLYFFLENVTGRTRFQADAFITSYSPSGPLDDTASLDVSLRLSAVVIGAVP
ncbi:MAG TPA: hypothetical protein VFH61_05840 [Thermoleophilia bacterium]|nr:hypothetical protein [Thermoleophilia bacterium]